MSPINRMLKLAKYNIDIRIAKYYYRYNIERIDVAKEGSV